jgi:hypothetical protein
MIVKERLFSGAISRKEQLAPLRVPQCNCKHAPEVSEALFAVIFIEVDNSFSIRAGDESVPASEQFLAKFRIVINFTIQEHPDGSIFIADRLVTAGDINNAEPPMAQTDSAIHINALVIRTAMTQSSVHLLYVVPGDGLGMVKLKNPADSAHSDYLLLKTFLRTYGRFQGKSMPKERKALFEMPG